MAPLLGEIRGFEWRDWVVEKIIATHGVDPAEVEECFVNRPQKVRRADAGKYQLFGQTDSGRYLFVVFLGWQLRAANHGARHAQQRAQRLRTKVRARSSSGVRSVAMAKIPEFKSEQEESEFWDEHEATEFFEETTPVAIEFVDARPRKTLISLRLDPGTIDALKQAAHRRGMGYQTLIRMWVLEKLAAEPANAGQGSAAAGEPADRRSASARAARAPEGPRRRESGARLRR